MKYFNDIYYKKYFQRSVIRGVRTSFLREVVIMSEANFVAVPAGPPSKLLSP